MSFTVQPMIFLLQESAAESGGLWPQIVQSNILNVVIAAVALFVIVRKLNVGSLLDQRQAAIVKSLKEAEEKRANALQELQAIETRTAKLSTEVSALLAEAQQTAEAVAESIIQGAEADAAKIISNAQKCIAQEEKTAARELEQRLMQEALHGARQLLESTLSPEDKHDSIKAFVDQLPVLFEKEAQS